jgi:hypothetical protein
MAIPKGLPVLRALSYLEAGVNPYLYDENELLKFSNWQKVQVIDLPCASYTTRAV